MSDTMWVVTVFVVLTVMGVPLIASVGIATAVALYLIDIPFTLLSQTGFTALQPFPLLTIPLFILAGQLMEKGGMSNRLILIANALVGAYKGSLGLVTVLGCMFFAALSGSGPATTAAIGSVTIPSMLREGYSPRFAAAVSASAGALGSMIPPSNLLIIYALVGEESIPRLFLAGIVPGIFVGLLLLVVAGGICIVYGYGGKGEPFSWRPLLKAVWDGKWAIGAPVLILGGIYGGIFTPTEAASVAVFYALFVGVVVYRELTWTQIYGALRFTALMAGLLLMLTPTIAFGQLAAFYDMPQLVEDGILQFTQNPIIVMCIIGIFYIFIGTFMESLAQIILFTPVLLPVVVNLGIDPVLFGVFTVMTCEIGFLTPPMGGNLFIAARVTGISVEEVSIGVLPLIVPYIIGLLFMIFFPEFVLYLPDFFYGARP
jgi:tripartite ATP-independent transporter DctM subunit